MTRGDVVVVGLGPAGADLLVPAARAAITKAATRFTRTVRHPAIDDLAADGVTFGSFDDVYERAQSIDDVYATIASTLADAAGQHGEVLYAVPGNPAVAERSVELLRARDDVRVRVVPGLSFADLAWAALGVDPVARHAEVVDGHDFSLDATTGSFLLLAQVDTRFVLSDVKLELLEVLAPHATVTVLQRLGLPDESVRRVALEDLDRDVDPDHLTALAVDLGGQNAGAAFARFVALTARLRDPGGCPWDAEQSHHSLARYVVEEAYEAVEAIESLPGDAPAGEPDDGAYAALEEELGDLLYQVVFQAKLASEAGAFTVDDVIRGVHDKLVRRHPHVFGTVEAGTTDEVLRNWEQIKRAEKGRTSLMAGVDAGLPSLLYAHKVLRKAASVGLADESVDDAAARVRDAADAYSRVGDDDVEATERALGDVLAGAVRMARARGVDGETALRGWAARFRSRFEVMEQLAEQQGVDLARADAATVRELWDDAGRRT
ncbi:MAG TPA: nucleoside triphosphate pyrophosphohydrolase [Acidimicrobiia bacterium]|nr:nucleoside triphosphate pyrophosphohydrolase [Acidimicrobiia bacterium]